ncbi:MAG: hypothetical protein J1E63_10800 [Muribaculaceae bacterium]|nr:hypothetical protein [Muribaculaceae bacterium]
MKNRISALALSLVAVGCTFVACTNEDVLLSDGNIGLAKAPDVVAYSGNVTLQASRPGSRVIDYGTRAYNTEGNRWNENWDCIPNVDLTEADLAEIKKRLSPGHYVENEIVLPFENYWVQQVFKGDAVYKATDKDGNETVHEILGSNQMDKLLAYNDIYVNEWDIYSRDQFNGGVYEHINNFNNGDNKTGFGEDGCGISHVGTTLMTDMPTTGMTAQNQFGFHESYGTNPKYYNNYYIIEYNGDYYVGFDYEMHKDVNNPGEARDVERDWCFTDWIVKITPAYAKGTTPENPGNGGNQGGETVDPEPEPEPDPVEPPVDDKCAECGHEHSHHHGEGADAFCEDCLQAILQGGNGVCAGVDPEPEQPEQPEQPGDEPTDTPVVGRSNEVEVNLNAAEKNDDLLESHLSIHVRAATDVRIFIPVATEYYCEGDDMEIVMKHEANHMIHGGPDVLEYQLKGSDLVVTLTIEYLPEGILITTDGIDQAVIDWCAETCNGDGITFEIWNYFNNGLSLDELKYWLNKSTIEFLDQEPDYYINAFTQDGGAKNGDDCKVNIIDSQVNDFGFVGEGEHLNGSPYNEIYKKHNQPENKPEPKPEPK